MKRSVGDRRPFPKPRRSDSEQLQPNKRRKVPPAQSNADQLFKSTKKLGPRSKSAGARRSTSAGGRGVWRRVSGALVYVAMNGAMLTGRAASDQAKLDERARETGRALAMETDEKVPAQLAPGVETDIDTFKIVPELVRNEHKAGGIRKLYEWQAELLTMPDVTGPDAKNLIYAAPTSGGKTLVAEFLMLHRMIHGGQHKKGLFILPYLSVVAEKAADLQTKWNPIGYTVGSSASESSALAKATAVAPPASIDHVDVMVCTIERANSIINRLLNERRLDELGVVVVDELHMLGDPHRGYILELLLTKLLASGAHVYIIGMSATLPDLGKLAKWLNATHYTTDFRPVQLQEMVMYNGDIYDAATRHCVRQLLPPRPADYTGRPLRSPHAAFVELCKEVVLEGHSVLVFCSSKKKCETCCASVAKDILPARHHVAELRELVVTLDQLPDGICDILSASLPKGVAYHHAGMTGDERKLIEDAFRKGIVKVLMATSTLAAGVNLPARRVIFHEPKIGRDNLDVTRYRQMAGRAGRAGQGNIGESIVMCSSEHELKHVMGVVSAPMPQIKSCLAGPPEETRNTRTVGLRRIVLDLIASGSANTVSDIRRWVAHSLLQVDQDEQTTRKQMQGVMRFLREEELVHDDPVYKPEHEEKRIAPTQLGSAVFASGVTPEEGLRLFKDMAKAREGFITSTNLHACYLVAPFELSSEHTTDWNAFSSNFMSQRTNAQQVWERVSNMPACAISQCGVKAKLRTNEVRRLYNALILEEIIKETPLKEIGERFDNLSRGALQQLQTKCAAYAGLLKVFCEELGWRFLAVSIAHLQEMLEFGVKDELLPLMRIPHVKAFRARIFYMAGCEMVEDIAALSAEDIASLLARNAPFRDGRGLSEDHSQYRQRQHLRTAERIRDAANRLKKRADAEAEASPPPPPFSQPMNWNG